MLPSHSRQKMKTVHLIDFHFKQHNEGIRTQILQLAFVITCFLLKRQSPINEASRPVGGGDVCTHPTNPPPYGPAIGG